jgi:hypothetical protein
MTACEAGTVAGSPPVAPAAATEPQNRLVYPQADRRAGELAERLVSVLASTAAPGARALGPGVVAQGLSPGALATALLERSEAGYLLALASRPHHPCRRTRALLARVPWLAERLAHPPLTALVDTRARAIAGERMPAVWADGYGDPLFSPRRERQGERPR